MIRTLNEITPVSTSHGVGQKRVLLAANESGCSLTQIAVTELKEGEIAVAHIHPDMQEGFYVLSGQLEVSLNENIKSNGPFTHSQILEKKNGSFTNSLILEKKNGSFTNSQILEGKEKTIVGPDTFVFVEHCTSHEMRAITDCRIMTIGCVIEATRNKYYPMLFKQNRKTLVWGTEDWTVSGVPNSESEVENGTWARYNLSEVIARHPAEILGRQVAEKYNNRLPLLAKIIDAKQDLSIQVHPNDEMAQRVHGKSGKSEMWYILDAEPGAYLYAGFKTAITPAEFKQLIENSRNSPILEDKSKALFTNSLILEDKKEITDVLARHEVHPGDVFYLPAGRVHAIGGGIRLAEIQQSSDLTYRIFDYNRPGLDGKPRELHTELAAQAIDYTVYPEYKTSPSAGGQKGTTELLNTPYFSINILDIKESIHRNMVRYDSFVILMNLGADCRVRVRATGTEITLPANESCLIPACIADYDIIPLNSSSDKSSVTNSLILEGNKTKILEAFINNKKSIGRLISDFLRLN